MPVTGKGSFPFRSTWFKRGRYTREADLYKYIGVGTGSAERDVAVDWFFVPAPTGIQFVQSNSVYSSGSSVVCAYRTNNKAGSLLVLQGASPAGYTVSSVSDTQGNTWTKVTGATGGAAQRHEIWYAANAAAGSNTVTASLSGSAPFFSYEVHEYSGADTSAPLDQAALNEQTNPGLGVDAVTSGTVTTTTPGQLIFGGAALAGGSAGTIHGSGFTVREYAVGDALSEDRIQAAAGSVAVTFTALAADNDYITGIATFKAATSTIALDGTSALSLTTSGTLTTEIPLTGSLTLSLTTSGGLSTGIPLTGASSLALTTSAGLTTAIPLTGSVQIVLTTSAALTTAIPLLGSSALALSTAGALTTAIPLDGSSTLALTTAGSLTTGILLSGSSSLVLTADGSLASGAALVGTSTLTLSSTADLLTAIQLSGASNLVMLASADLSTGSGGVSESGVYVVILRRRRR